MLSIFSYSDAQIIEAISTSGKNESKAIQHLLDKNRKQIKAYVLKNSGNESDAEMVLVEGVTELIFNIRKKTFRGDSAIGTYLYAICRGMWLKTLKKRKRLTDFDEAGEKATDDVKSPLQFFSETQLKDEVDHLLGQLGEMCKLVLEMWSNHYSMTEIAHKAGYKNSQIAMNKKNRCLGKLKEIVQTNVALRDNLKSYFS